MENLKNILIKVLKLRNLFLIFSILIVTSSAFSQEEDYEFVGLKKEKKKKKTTKKTESDIDFDLLDEELSVLKFKLSLFIPSVAGEIKLADNFSLEAAVKLNALFAVTGTPSQPKIEAIAMPVFHLEPKWNYNVKKRIKKGKKVSGFSSNFISLFASYRLPVPSPNTKAHHLLIGPTWGLQRQLGRYGYLKFNSGLGYAHFFDSTIRSQIINQSPLNIPLQIIVDFQIGFMF